MSFVHGHRLLIVLLSLGIIVSVPADVLSTAL